MPRYVCIHGHFYQPPRENPWLETVEVQDSADPYHDWNERIAAECYGPNAAARILDGEGRIERIVNNYARISFDFGPTLLSWMETAAPAVYRAVLAADQESRERFSGHGNALAQSYHHSILPLANRRDKRTEILWGLSDFAHRFGRPAEGFWLPETAVDLESLEILAELGVRFTLLEPRQARRFRPLAGGAWEEATDGIDGRVPYRLSLPSGRSLALFFYDGGISRAIAFERLLASGEALVDRLLGAFSPRAESGRPELVHIATDGETYGHHHRFGDMALAYAIHRLEEGRAEDQGVTLTNYGELLARHPPELEVEIVENTSWSCAHGIERWQSDCGCSTGGREEWNQAWRAPLRAALDSLRDELAAAYEAAAAPLFADPWAARDDYVQVLLDRSADNVSAFLARHRRGGRERELPAAERHRALKLLELQRQTLLMYTSCGWFFHDLAGIETVQVLSYAGRAVELAQELFGDGVEERFLARLAQAESNRPEEGDGRRIYERHVRPAAALSTARAGGGGASFAASPSVPTPLATYRLQLHAGFGFDAAAAIAPYLRDLGVSHVYCSPYLQAAAGSTHGYDVVDPGKVNEELGGEAGHARFCQALGEARLGQLLDIVPNHMSIDPRGGAQNVWWWDVLENGPASRYAAYFDVDWDPPQARLRNLVLLPILGDHYGRVLAAGELQLVRRGGAFEFHYHEHRLPVAPRSLDTLIAEAARRSGSPDLAFIADALGRLPASTATDRESVMIRHRDKEVLRGQLARLAGEKPEVAAAVDAVVSEVNADPDRLGALLERQNYRPAFWRRAGRELDYRRFFDVHTLVGLRTEDERVFSDTHARVLDWVAKGVLDGLRVDHPDGLYDPRGYFDRLRQRAPRAYLVAEKILAPAEPLPAGWPIQGTTGYDFLNLANGLFVDPAGEGPLSELWREIEPEESASGDWPAIVRAKKRLVAEQLLASDVNRLAEVFLEVAERHRRDYTRHELRQVLAEVAACFPVYRTYVRARERREIGERDILYIEEAIATARERRGDLPGDLFDFLRDLLTLKVGRLPGSLEDPEGELAMRFQQLTSPVMAKGVEDTAFYTFLRLVSLNEVGGDPGRFGVSPEEFHRACRETQERWPEAMLATSTHDTKRSEDVRARLNLLSEIPVEWAAAVRRWRASNDRHWRGRLPERSAEYLLYQTLVGAWPIDRDRLWAYLEKALREAKQKTSWTRPDPAYEAVVRDFTLGVLEDSGFREDLAAFVDPLVAPGRVHSLAQVLLKLTAPGVPDLYQGSELWDLSLVDPDNRRPVDYALRRRLLAELASGLSPEAILARADEGLPKLWLIRQALHLRRRHPELFARGSTYRPLPVRGARAAHAVAFARGEGVVTIVPRLVLRLGGDWGDTVLELPAGRWSNELTGEEVEGGERCLQGLLGRFPAALLHLRSER
jgi:(1->4)-alpha-D-glucan 1-alpha-D-glucosylmutase